MLHKAVPLSGNMAGVTVHAHNTTSCLLLFFGHPSFSPHPVSLYPEGASAAQWALKLKTEQIKVTVGGVGGQPAPGHAICRGCLCACVCKYFYLSKRGTSPERALVKRLLSYMLTLAALLRLRSAAFSLPSPCLKNTPGLSSLCVW